MEITLSAVIEAARLRRAGVTAEVAGYIVLLAVQELARSPRRVTTDALLLTELGELRVANGGDRAGEMEIETALRQLLATLTGLAQSAAPALKLAAERSAGGHLGSLEVELTSALIPINHAAARRALARLYREAHKSRVETLSLAAESRTLSTPSPTPVSVAQRPSGDAPLRAPASVSLAVPAAPAEPSGAELEIDVDVTGFEARRAETAAAPVVPSPLPSERMSPGQIAVGARASESTPQEPTAHRSDLRELLAGFLSHTRSEEQMTADLRRMIGLEGPPLSRPSSAPPPLGSAPTHAR